DAGGADRAAQHRGVHDVGEQPLLAHQLAAADGLLAALLGQGHVHPAGEEVLGVPVALAVAQQDQGRHGRPFSSVGGSGPLGAGHSVASAPDPSEPSSAPFEPWEPSPAAWSDVDWSAVVSRGRTGAGTSEKLPRLATTGTDRSTLSPLRNSRVSSTNLPGSTPSPATDTGVPA